jgi:2-polyprenyl-3-methyl-5-hydroxy-6-metoxy-1,4-benzoquinol methylase
MNPDAMKPFGRALFAWLEGDANAQLLVRRDDGEEATIPAGVFFRDESAFTEIEWAALRLCEGRVLDVGAGAGSHSLALQRGGHPVTAIDISPEAVSVAQRRGVTDAHCADIVSFEGGPFDTLLMMGHGIGMVETIDGLSRFLARAHSLLTDGGQVLLDSLDVRVTDDPAHLTYHEANRKTGRYIGEIRMQFEFQGRSGPYCGWLQVDAETLCEHAVPTGWQCEVVVRGDGGNYLARLRSHSSVVTEEVQ